jgi:hypothetical protein
MEENHTKNKDEKDVRSKRSTTDRVLLTAAIGLGLAIAVSITGGYVLGWQWTGLAERTFWDWLKLLIVPAVLALGGHLQRTGSHQGGHP